MEKQSNYSGSTAEYFVRNTHGMFQVIRKPGYQPVGRPYSSESAARELADLMRISDARARRTEADAEPPAMSALNDGVIAQPQLIADIAGPT